MHARELLEANLAVVDRAIDAVCAHASLSGADAEDFSSSVKVALLENECAIVRQWEGRSSFATYVTVVVRRLLVDHWRSAGRWYASAEARRQGEAAVLLERLIARDRRTPEEAFGIVREAYPHVTATQLAAIAAVLPKRAPRPRLVPLAEEDGERIAAAQRADDGVTDFDAGRRAQQASRVVRQAMQAMSAEDRTILRLRYVDEVTIAGIARAMGLAQRPLYRRIEALLATLRAALDRTGLDASSIADLIGNAGSHHLDFQLGGKTEAPQPSISDEGSEELQR